MIDWIQFNAYKFHMAKSWGEIAYGQYEMEESWVKKYTWGIQLRSHSHQR